jgi:hypothetical protein
MQIGKICPIGDEKRGAFLLIENRKNRRPDHISCEFLSPFLTLPHGRVEAKGGLFVGVFATNCFPLLPLHLLLRMHERLPHGLQNSMKNLRPIVESRPTQLHSLWNPQKT